MFLLGHDEEEQICKVAEVVGGEVLYEFARSHRSKGREASIQKARWIAKKPLREFNDYDSDLVTEEALDLLEQMLKCDYVKL